MIRHLRLLDLPRQLLPGRLEGDDLACTRAELLGDVHHLSPFELARWTLANGREQHSLAVLRDGKLGAVALVHMRHGPRAWEVAHLFVSKHALDEIQALLDRAAAHVGARGGERLFMRIACQSPIQEAVRRAGFFPAFTEELFTLNRPILTDAHGPGLSLRALMPSDTYGLFRLYNATLPASVRAVIGLTLDQWLDAREDGPGRGREYVWDNEGEIRGWLRLDERDNALTIEALLHPNEGLAAPLLVGRAARLAQGQSLLAWVVPSFQPALAAALQHRAWESSAMYAVLVRSVARRVEQPAFLPVQA